MGHLLVHPVHNLNLQPVAVVERLFTNAVWLALLYDVKLYNLEFVPVIDRGLLQLAHGNFADAYEYFKKLTERNSSNVVVSVRCVCIVCRIVNSAV